MHFLLAAFKKIYFYLKYLKLIKSSFNPDYKSLAIIRGPKQCNFNQEWFSPWRTLELGRSDGSDHRAGH